MLISHNGIVFMNVPLFFFPVLGFRYFPHAKINHKNGKKLNNFLTFSGKLMRIDYMPYIFLWVEFDT